MACLSDSAALCRAASCLASSSAFSAWVLAVSRFVVPTLLLFWPELSAFGGASGARFSMVEAEPLD